MYLTSIITSKLYVKSAILYVKIPDTNQYTTYTTKVQATKTLKIKEIITNVIISFMVVHIGRCSNHIHL